MTKEFKFYQESKIQLEMDEKEVSGLIEAVLTTFGPREGEDGRRFNYVAAPFMAWAKEFEALGKPLPMYFQHDDNALPVGQWTSFEFNEVGMTGFGKMYTNTSAGRDLYTIMKESPMMVGGVSVGAYADEFRFVDAEGMEVNRMDEDDAYFQITKGGLREVSIVMQPNNLEASIKKLEYFHKDGKLNLKQIEEALRDVGLNRKDATTASSIFNGIFKLRDVVEIEVGKTTTPSELDAVAENEILKALNEREILQTLNKRLKRINHV